MPAKRIAKAPRSRPEQADIHPEQGDKPSAEDYEGEIQRLRREIQVLRQYITSVERTLALRLSLQ